MTKMITVQAYKVEKKIPDFHRALHKIPGRGNRLSGGFGKTPETNGTRGKRTKYNKTAPALAPHLPKKNP